MSDSTRLVITFQRDITVRLAAMATARRTSVSEQVRQATYAALDEYEMLSKPDAPEPELANGDVVYSLETALVIPEPTMATVTFDPLGDALEDKAVPEREDPMAMPMIRDEQLGGVSPALARFMKAGGKPPKAESAPSMSDQVAQLRKRGLK